MKWFKHFSDAYSNIKMQHLIAEVGMSGYGFFWVTCELVAQQGDNFRIKSEKNWKKVLSHITGEKIETCDKFLSMFAEKNLIDKKALENNDIFIPKMGSYSDEYTDKLRRVSRQRREKVGLEQNRTEEEQNRTDKTAFGELGKVLLTEAEHSKLIGFFGEKTTNELIFELDTYVASKGKNYKSHYATLLNWAKRKADKQGAKKNNIAFQ